MDWNDVRHFLALARLGSVRAAGAALGVSHSTVARRVDALEAQLATQLFDRHRDGYELTEAGHRMVPGAERIEREMAALERDLAGQDERLAGPVSLTCCDEFVSAMLMHDFRAFCADYPDIELQIAADSRSYDLSKREADIAVRILALGTTPPEHLIGARLAPLAIANFISVDRGDDVDPDVPGTTSRWIAFEGRRHLDKLIAGSSYPDLEPWGAFSTVGLLAQAARQGLGVVMLPCYVGDADPGLRRLAKPDVRHVADLWLLSHPDLRNNARLRAARRCVTETFRTRQALFSGDAPASAGPAGASRGAIQWHTADAAV